MNEDISRLVVVSTEFRTWTSLSESDVCVLEAIPDGAESLFVRVAPFGELSLSEPGDREIFLLSGSVRAGKSLFGAGSYLRLPAKYMPLVFKCGEEGCLAFVKRTPPSGNDPEAEILFIDTMCSGWVRGLVSGLNVMPLFSSRTENTALVRWDPGTVFEPHRHFGGEEVLVVSGVFEDEYGVYPEGTWYRSPHLSHHDPFSRNGCTILVKTGHLSS